MDKIKPIILFDIDYTLIDNRKLQKLVKSHFSRKFRNFLKGASVPRLQIKSELYSLNYILFGKPSNPSIKILNKSFLNEKVLKESLFDDVVPTLEKLKKIAVLGVFSQGIHRYQLKKIELAGLQDFFDKRCLFIFLRKQSRIRDLVHRLKKTNLFLLDDKPEVVKLFSKLGANAFLIQRTSKNVSTKGVRKVSSLSVFLEEFEKSYK